MNPAYSLVAPSPSDSISVCRPSLFKRNTRTEAHEGRPDLSAAYAAMTNLLKTSARHNLLQPEPASGPLPDQKRNADPGARYTECEYADGKLALKCDVTDAWASDNVQKNVRAVISERARAKQPISLCNL